MYAVKKMNGEVLEKGKILLELVIILCIILVNTRSF